MGQKISKRRRASLIADLVEAKGDLMALAQSHHLSPDDLAQWVGQPENATCLTGLCVLADLQTQVLLSRYRLVAASKLIELATREDEGKPDVARRACVDLLKLDLKRADIPSPPEATEALPPALGTLLESMSSELDREAAEDEGASW